MKVKYYGTSLTEKGHYLVYLESQGLDWRKSLDIRKYPFDIYGFTKAQPNGFVSKEIIGKYKIIAIQGSCIDARGGCVSVFITEEDVTIGQFEEYLLNHPWVIKMLDMMPFDVDFGAK